jgi:hypothetical protein
MPCDAWCGLLARYRSAVNTYNEAAIDLSPLPGAAFNEAWQRAEQARKQSDKCRADLLLHENDHVCLGVRQPEGNKEATAISTEEFILGDQGQSGG